MKLQFINSGYFNAEEMSLVKTLAGTTIQDLLYALGLINMKHGFNIVSEFGAPHQVKPNVKTQSITFYTEQTAVQVMLCNVIAPFMTDAKGAQLLSQSKLNGYELMTASDIQLLLTSRFNQPMPLHTLGSVLKKNGFYSVSAKFDGITRRVYPVIKIANENGPDIPRMLTAAGFKAINRLLTIEI